MDQSFTYPDGLFGRTDDGRLLFFTFPQSRTGFVVPDTARAESLRQASRYWGVFELATVAIVSPLALHFGAMGLLAAFVVFSMSSAAAYRYIVHKMVAGLERVTVEGRAMTALSEAAANSLRALSEETHGGFLWFYQVMAVFPFAGSLLMVLDGGSVRHILGGLFGMVFFGGAGLAVSYMLALKHGSRSSVAEEAGAVETRRAVV